MGATPWRRRAEAPRCANQYVHLPGARRSAGAAFPSQAARRWRATPKGRQGPGDGQLCPCPKGPDATLQRGIGACEVGAALAPTAYHDPDLRTTRVAHDRVLASCPGHGMMRVPREAQVTVQALWCEVLLQALTDGLNGLPAQDHVTGDSTELDARSYILVPNLDFEMVCQLAGAEPEAMRRDFRVRLARRDPLNSHELWGNRRAANKPARKHVPTYTYQGRSLTLREWAEISECSRELLMDRVNRQGWCIERALTEPVGRRMPKPSRSDQAQVAQISRGLSGL